MTFWINKSVLLAGKYDSNKITFPVYVTPKIDGIRAIRSKDNMLSRTFKPIPNENLNILLTQLLPAGIDGEIILNSNFQQTTSFVMTKKKDLQNFTFYIFDYVKDINSLNRPYLERMNDLKYLQLDSNKFANIVILYPVMMHNKEDLEKFEVECLDRGFEGVMIRKGDGTYKLGRSTTKDQILLKMKRFNDDEAVITGYEELKSENVKRDNMLGAFNVKMKNGVEFSVGSGFTDSQRKEYWENRTSLLGKQITFQYFEQGIKTAPRFPTFKGFRDSVDIL